MADKPPIRSKGMRHIATLPADASVCFFGDKIIIASPTSPPRILEP